MLHFKWLVELSVSSTLKLKHLYGLYCGGVFVLFFETGSLFSSQELPVYVWVASNSQSCLPSSGIECASSRGRVHNGGRDMAASGRSRKLRLHFHPHVGHRKCTGSGDWRLLEYSREHFLQQEALQPKCSVPPAPKQHTMVLAKLEDNSRESLLSFHHVAPGNALRLVRLVALSHLIGPGQSFLYVYVLRIGKMETEISQNNSANS